MEWYEWISLLISNGIVLAYVTFYYDRRKENRQLLRERGEKLYLLANEYLVTETSFYAAAMPQVLAGVESFMQFQRRRKSETPRSLDIILIIDVYFPKLRKDYDEYIKRFNKMNEIILREDIEHAHRYSRNNIDEYTLEVAAGLKDMTGEFNKKIIAEIQRYIP
jgi:hypothetical protein